MKEIEKEILYQRNHKSGHPDDRFIQVMSDFITVAGYKYSELEEKFKEMEERVRHRYSSLLSAEFRLNGRG